MFGTLEGVGNSERPGGSMVNCFELVVVPLSCAPSALHDIVYSTVVPRRRKGAMPSRHERDMCPEKAAELTFACVKSLQTYGTSY